MWRDVEGHRISNMIYGGNVDQTDLAAEYQAVIADGHLFLLINVADDTLQPIENGVAWDDDSVEIFIDGDNSKSGFYDSTNDYQLVFGIGRDQMVTGINSAPIAANIQHIITTTQTGYQLQIAIPLAQLGISRASGEKFGLDIQITDDDNGGSVDNKISWSTEDDNGWPMPASFGTVTVGGTTGLSLEGNDLYLPLFVE